MSDASYVPDDHTYQSLHKEIDNGIHLLRKLSGLEKTHDVGKSQRLPVQELEQAAGLAIFEASKLGLVITGVSGRGFLIKKLSASPSRWSAPVLFTLKSFGIGASAGFSSAHTLLVLDTDKAVTDFLHTQISLDSEMTVAAGKAARHMHDSELNVTHPGDSFRGAMYSVAHGAMVDVSFQGVKVSVNEKEMKKLYGPHSDDKLVLAGKQPQLPILEPLLSEINLLVHGGSNTHPTKRGFNL